MSGVHEVVISGIGGMFPKSRGIEELARNILSNKYLVQRHETTCSLDRRGRVEQIFGRVPDHNRFDNAFFGIHQKLAAWSDPGATTALERTFEAIVDAGIHPHSLRGSNTNVCTGMFISDFEALHAYANTGSGYSIMGHARTMMANRISYFFDLKGHSSTCSSTDAFGPMCLGRATAALHNGECDAALVVASTTLDVSMVTRMFADLGMVTKDLLCHPFDDHASGTHRSEACIALLLQRMDQAKRCYATVVASDAQYVGAGTVRFDPTLPNPAGVQAFLADFYRSRGVDPKDVAYVEADGLGHRVLDALELDVLDKVLASDRPSPLLVGSVKSNVGHTEVASGLVGVAKAVIAMETGIIPATLNHVKGNTEARGLAQGRIKILSKNTPLPADGEVLIGVNTHTIFDTHGHCILRRNSKKKPSFILANELPRLVVLGGRTEEGLLDAAEKIRSAPFDPEYLRLVQDALGPSIRGYEYRTHVICPPDRNETLLVARVEKRTLWFVYSGMGSQWAGMGQALMVIPLFADTIDRLHTVLLKKGLDLKLILSEIGPAAFDNIMKSFVGITACQIALTNVLRAIGLVPDGIVGHSVGELGCAYADGCLTEEQTILAAYARGKASNEATLIKGMMAAVGLGYKDIVGRLPPSVEVACRNSATSCTLSGPAEDVKEFVRKLTDEGVFARAVNVSDIAYHSRYIKPAAPFLRKYLEEVIPEPKRRSDKWISTSAPLNQWNTTAAQFCSAEYQTNNLLSPVLFEDALAMLPEQAVLVEIAPHGLLQAILKRALPDNVHVPLTQRDHPKPVRMLLNALGRISLYGHDLDLPKLYPDVCFPVSRGTPSLTPLLSWVHDCPMYHKFVRSLEKEPGMVVREVHPYSPFANINEKASVTISEILETVLGALEVIQPEEVEKTCVVFEGLRVSNQQEIPKDGVHEMTGTVSRGTGVFEVSGPAGLLMSGKVRTVDTNLEKPLPPLPPPRQPPTEVLSGTELLADLATKGLAYSDKYHALKSVSLGEEEWRFTVDTTSSREALLEALLQVVQYYATELEQRLLVVKGCRQLQLDPAKLRAKAELEVRFQPAVCIMQADGLYASGFSFTKVQNDDMASKTPKGLQFVPYGSTALKSFEEFVGLAVQLSMDSAQCVCSKDQKVVHGSQTKPIFSVLEMQNCVGVNALGSAVRDLIQHKLCVDMAAQTVSVAADRSMSLPTADPSRAFLTLTPPSTLAEAVKVLEHVGGMLITCSKDRLPAEATQGLRMVAELRADKECLSLLRLPVSVAAWRVVEVPADNPAPARLADVGPDKPVLLVWRGQPHAGIAGAVAEVRKTPYAAHARMVFILDEKVPRFTLKEALYAEQLKLNLPVNVLWRGTWGSWRTFRSFGEIPSDLFYTWSAGVELQALGFNPRNLVPPAGEQAWSGHLDYVGVGQKGRVMGVARWFADHRRALPDPQLTWAVPTTWKTEEAATVPYAYAMVYHALLVKAQLRRGESILVHEGASAVGQAAIRVAMHAGCSAIYTTVGSDAERLLLRRTFPQMEQGNILSCTDQSFETAIRLSCHGVDVVLGRLPGEKFKASMRCLKPWGRYLHWGREDMLEGTTFGSQQFLSSITVIGLSGDELFLPSEQRKEDRKHVVAAFKEGLAAGVVQPIVGAQCRQTLRKLDALRGESRDLRTGFPAKTVLDVRQKSLRKFEVDFKKTLVLVGVGYLQHEWLQVAGWLAQLGARELLVASGPVTSPALTRHRQRTLQRQFNTNLRVEEARDAEVIKKVVRSTDADAVIVLDRGDGVAAMLHDALPADTALLVLARDAGSACKLAPLVEARRDAGLRAACLAGTLNSVADRLTDLLNGTLPAVTLLDQEDAGDKGKIIDIAPRGMPIGVRRLAGVSRDALPGCRLREFPSLGLPSRHAREAQPVFAVWPLGALDSEDKAGLACLASRLLSPLVCVETGVDGDLCQQARDIATAIVGARPFGTYNVLGWGLGTPLALEVSRRLESDGHTAVTFLVDGDVQRVQQWAARQTERSLVQTVLGEEAVDHAEDVDAVDELLVRLPASQRALVENGLNKLRTAIAAVATHSLRHAQGRIVDVQTFGNHVSFIRGDRVTFRLLPGSESVLGLASPWLANVINEASAYSKEIRDEKVLPLLRGLNAC